MSETCSVKKTHSDRIKCLKSVQQRKEGGKISSTNLFLLTHYTQKQNCSSLSEEPWVHERVRNKLKDKLYSAGFSVNLRSRSSPFTSRTFTIMSFLRTPGPCEISRNRIMPHINSIRTNRTSAVGSFRISTSREQKARQVVLDLEAVE